MKSEREKLIRESIRLSGYEHDNIYWAKEDKKMVRKILGKYWDILNSQPKKL